MAERKKRAKKLQGLIRDMELKRELSTGKGAKKKIVDEKTGKPVFIWRAERKK